MNLDVEDGDDWAVQPNRQLGSRLELWH